MIDPSPSRVTPRPPHMTPHPRYLIDHPRWLLLLVIAVAGCSASEREPTPRQPQPARNADWPGLFGPTNDAHTPETVAPEGWLPAGPPEVWRRAVGTGYSSPVVAEGTVVVLHRVADEEIIEAFDAATGETRWAHRYPTDFVCDFEYSDGPYATPTIHNGRVYTFGAQWQARCLDLRDGSVVWSRELADEYDPVTAEGFPCGVGAWIDDERLVINLGDAGAGIVALDPTTGATLWSATDHRASYTTPRYAEPHGRPTLYAFTFEGLVALDPRDGRVWWFEKHRPSSPLSVNATTPVAWGDRVLAVTGPGPGAVCFEDQPAGAARVVWKDRRAIDSQFNTLMAVGEHVYGYTSSRQFRASLRCVALDTGRLAWDYPSVLKRGSGLVTGDRLLLLGEAGHLAVIEADPAEPRVAYFSEAPLLAAPCYSTPALSGGLLYLRNTESLVAYRARPETPAEPR